MFQAGVVSAGLGTRFGTRFERPGDRVTVAPDDYGRFQVEGAVVSSSAQHIAIRRSDPVAGEVVVHFPRAGFVIARVAQSPA